VLAVRDANPALSTRSGKPPHAMKPPSSARAALTRI
jgi:hypothetical protein